MVSQVCHWYLIVRVKTSVSTTDRRDAMDFHDEMSNLAVWGRCGRAVFLGLRLWLKSHMRGFLHPGCVRQPCHPSLDVGRSDAMGVGGAVPDLGRHARSWNYRLEGSKVDVFRRTSLLQPSEDSVESCGEVTYSHKQCGILCRGSSRAERPLA